MSEARKESGWPVVVGLVLVAVLALLGVYVAGYYSLGTAEDIGDNSPMIFRLYGAEWQATIFTPAAVIESWCRGFPVRSVHLPSGFHYYSP